MPKPLIFISHSVNDDPLAEEFLDKLYIQLQDGGFDVRVDRKHLALGDPWRRQLHLWMLQAHGAIILFSKKALRSDWVYYESTILTSRRYQHPDFLVVPVMLPDFDKADRDWQKFSPMLLEEIQRAPKGTTEEVVYAIIQRLAPLKQAFLNTPFEKVEIHFRAWFQPINPEILRIAAEQLYSQQELAGEVDYSLPITDPIRLLVEGLMRADLEVAIKAIDILQHHLQPEVGRKLAEFIASLWVDPRAVARIPEVISREKGQRAVSVNGRKQTTGIMYLRRARCDLNFWTVLPTTVDAGEDVVGRLVQQIREHWKRVNVSQMYSDEDSDESLNFAAEQDPIFVLIRGFLKMEDLALLRDYYPAVIFFLLPGDEELDEQECQLNHIELLRPKLVPGREMKAEFLFNQVMRWFRATNAL